MLTSNVKTFAISVATACALSYAAPVAMHGDSPCGTGAGGGSVITVTNSNGSSKSLLCSANDCCEPVNVDVSPAGGYSYCGCPDGNGGFSNESECCHPIMRWFIAPDGTVRALGIGARGDCGTSDCPGVGKCKRRTLAPPQPGAAVERVVTCYGVISKVGDLAEQVP